MPAEASFSVALSNEFRLVATDVIGEERQSMRITLYLRAAILPTVDETLEDIRQDIFEVWGTGEQATSGVKRGNSPLDCYLPGWM